MIRPIPALAFLACAGGGADIADDGVERIAVTAELPDPGTRLGWLVASAAMDLERGTAPPTALVVEVDGTTRLRVHQDDPEQALQRSRDVVSGQFAGADIVLVHPGKAQLATGLGEVWIAELCSGGQTRRLALPFRRTPVGIVLEGSPLTLPAGEGSGLFRPIQPGPPIGTDDPLHRLLEVGWNSLPPEPTGRPPQSVVHTSALGVALTDAWTAAGWALAHGMWSTSDGEPLATFAVVVGPNGPVLLRFTGEGPEAAQARARKRLADEFALWPAVLVSQARLDLGGGRSDTILAEVFRPGAKPRVLARASATPETPPVFIGGWPSTDRNPVIGVADPVGTAHDTTLYRAFLAGWELHPYGDRFWTGTEP